MSLTFEGRQHLREQVSEVQRRRERDARRLEVVTTYGEVIHMGGGSRPLSEQLRGYPIVRTGEDSRWAIHLNRL